MKSSTRTAPHVKIDGLTPSFVRMLRDAGASQDVINMTEGLINRRRYPRPEDCWPPIGWPALRRRASEKDV